MDVERTGSSPRKSGLLVAGLGNILLCDDGVGVHAARALQEGPLEGEATVVEVGTAVLDALPLFERAERVIALDAVQAGGAPGTIYDLEPDALKSIGIGHSIHELGLRELFRMMSPESRPALRIFGVEPAVIDYGMELSPAVRAVLPRFVEIVREAAREWRVGSGPRAR